MNWTGGGKERAGSNPAPKLPSPSSLLCNLLISFRRETGAHSPREGGGAVLPGRMRGKAAPSPSSPVAGPKSAFSLRKEGRGDSLLQASPPVPLRPALRLRRPVARGRLWAGSLSPVSGVPGALRPPCCGRVRAPGVGRGRGVRSRFPSGSGVCMGASSFRGATGRCGVGAGGRGEPWPRALSASLPRASLSDHG